MDSDLLLDVVFYGDDFLDEAQCEVVRKSSKEILINNKKNNPSFPYTCLPYELKIRRGLNGKFYIDDVVAFCGNPDDFSANEIKF